MFLFVYYMTDVPSGHFLPVARGDVCRVLASHDFGPVWSSPDSVLFPHDYHLVGSSLLAMRILNMGDIDMT